MQTKHPTVPTAHPTGLTVPNVLIVSLLSLAPAGAASLQAAPADSVTVHGRVLDGQTRQPVALAVVEVVAAARRTLTDSAGRWVLPDLPTGPQLFEFSRLGYETYDLVMTVGTGTAINVELHPEPVVLAALAVTVDRFAERIRRVPYPAYAWDQATLAAHQHPSVTGFLHEQPWLMCPGSIVGCNTLLRGREISPAVFIDEIQRDWEYLTTYRTDQIYRIEFIRQCPMVRVYTTAFMNRVARGRARLPDSFVGDCPLRGR